MRNKISRMTKNEMEACLQSIHDSLENVLEEAETATRKFDKSLNQEGTEGRKSYAYYAGYLEGRLKHVLNLLKG